MPEPTKRDSRVAANLSKEKKDAIKHIAHSRSSPDHQCSIATIVREAVDTYLRVYPDMPDAAREQLPEDFEDQDPVFTPDGDIDIDAITGVSKDEPTEEGAEA